MLTIKSAGRPEPFGNVNHLQHCAYLRVEINMWVLLISLYLTEPILGQVQSKGIIQAPMQSYDQCVKSRDQIRAQWQLDGYRVSARCLRVPNYGTRPGQYND